MWCVSEAPGVSLGYPHLGTHAEIAVTLGIFYFQTALILREAMLVNGVLMSCESCQKLSEQQLKSIEDCDIK